VLSKPQSTPVVDAFRGHLSNRIKNSLRNKNTNLVIIHSGMTSQLQPLDVLINRPFLKCCLSNVEDGVQDDSEQSGVGASSSENESTTEGSLHKLSD
jgi:hypothetical protein